MLFPPSTTKAESTLMFCEALESGAAIRRLLTQNSSTLLRIVEHLKRSPPKFVTTCARGSSDNAATYAKYLIETQLGIPTSSCALSVSSIFESSIRGADSLCIAISQSGRSPDLLAAVQAYKASGAYIIAMVNDEASPLSYLADEVLPLRAGPELSVAATKSFIVSLVSIASLVACWTDNAALKADIDHLPDLITEAHGLDWTSAVKGLQTATNLYVIGRGYSYGIAQEAALKLKETCGLHAEAISSAEVQHGPMTLVQKGFPVLGFATSDAAGDDLSTIANIFANRSAKVWIAQTTHAKSAAYTTLPSIAANPIVEPMLMIQSFYAMASRLSVARSLDPDHPPYLNKVTNTV